MKRAAKKLIIVVLTCLVGLAVFGCSGGETERRYDHLVTFNYNVGAIDADCPDQYLGLKDGSKILIKPGYGNAFSEQPIANHYIEGWYLPALDEDGNPIVDEDGKVQLGDEWDFEAGVVSADITLYANVIANPTLTIVVDGGENVIFSQRPGATRQRPTRVFEPQKDGYTFLEYYEDETFETVFTWPYTFGTEDKTIYANFIEGEWTIVSSAADFNTALFGNNRIYVTADLDFAETDWIANKEFNGEIAGNGHAFTGIDCAFTVGRGTFYFGMFNTLGAQAYIHDLDITASATFNTQLTTPSGAALFAYTIESGARIINVTMRGTISRGNVIEGAIYELYGITSTTDLSGVTIETNDFSITVNDDRA